MMNLGDTIAISVLEELAGYVRSGYYTTLKIYQDDATLSWFVDIGHDSFYGSTLSEALAKAKEQYLE